MNGFFNICELSKKYRIKKVFYASSSSVYGENTKFPLTENQSIKPKNVYGLSKKFNEEMAEVYSLNSKTRFIGLRFFTVYGEWGRPDMMMVKYIMASLNSKKFELYNYGKHDRDFTYIQDVTNIINLLLNKKFTKHTVLNICSSRPINLKIVIKKIKKYLKKSIIIKKPIQIADIIKTHGSNTKLMKLINYKKFYSLDEGIKKTFEWCKKYNDLKRL